MHAGVVKMSSSVGRLTPSRSEYTEDSDAGDTDDLDVVDDELVSCKLWYVPGRF